VGGKEGEDGLENGRGGVDQREWKAHVFWRTEKEVGTKRPTTMKRAASTAGTVSPAAATPSEAARGSSIEASENQKMPPAMTTLPPYLVPPKGVFLFMLV
jgi:hypothetical protein